MKTAGGPGDEDPGGTEDLSGPRDPGGTAGAREVPARDRADQRITPGRDGYAAARDIIFNLPRADADTAGETGIASWGTAVLRAPTGRLPERVRGRDELLGRLATLLDQPDGRVHVLAGLGGTGKSTIALALAEEAAARGIPAWWVPAVEAETMTARLLELAEDLGAPPAEVAQAKAGQRNPADLLWRCLGQRAPWLLILDNVDDPGVLGVGDADAASGAGWLRPTAYGMVLVTSRSQEKLTWGRHAELHPVGWLERTDGARVLTDLAPHAGTPDEAAALAERLGGLPLALHHAGSQLASDFAAERTFTGYLKALNERFAKIMGTPSASRAGDAQVDRAIVTSTWELSLDALAANGYPQARPLLRVLCCLAPATLIPDALLDRAVLARVCDGDQDRTTEGLRALASVGLIATSRGADGTPLGVTVHPLVSETSRLRLDAEDPATTGSITVALLNTAAGGLDAELPADWPAWDQLGPHLIAVYESVAAQLPADDLDVLTGVTEQTGRAFTWSGRYAADLELAQFALQHLDRIDAERPASLRLRFRFASAYLFLGDSDRAEGEYRQVLDAQSRLLGPDHASTLVTRRELAHAIADQGRPEEAEHELRQILDTLTRVLGPDHASTLGARYQIAHAIADQGRPEEAEHELRQILDTLTRVLGPDHANTLSTRYEIARMITDQGRHEEAEHEYRRVLDAETRVLGPNHPSTLITRHGLARAIADQGRHQEAEDEYDELVGIETRVLGPNHPTTLDIRHGLAVALHRQGKVKAAQREFRAILEAKTRVLGPEHPSTRATGSWIE